MLTQLLEGFAHKLPGDPIENFTRNLVDSKEYPGPVHKCPKCGGQFHFRLCTRKRGLEMASAQAWCDDCKAAIAIDGIVPPPTWADKAERDNSTS